MNTSIVPMESIHLDQVHAIETACFSLPWSRGMMESELDNPTIAHYLVMLDDAQQVIGYAGFWKIVDEGLITNIAVRPDCQGKGYGKQLLFSLLSQAEKEGILRMTLEVRASNEPALKLYMRAGFLPAGIRKGYYQQPKEDAIIMWNEDVSLAAQKMQGML